MKPAATKTSGVVIPHQAKWYQRLAAWLLYSLLHLLAVTIRFRWSNSPRLEEVAAQGPVIFAIWHNRLALCLFLHSHYYAVKQPERRLAAMVSASKDGGFLAHALKLFNVQPVRGSSSRRGPQALREMVSWARQGHDLAITPDGPRGPCYVIAPGVTSLAQLTGMPIVPVTFNYTWKISLKSWDRFQIPLPFSRCDVNIGEPVHVPREATEEERETQRLLLENRLKELTVD